MLHEVFYWVLNMSIIASVFGILLYSLRLIKGFPKLASYLLWAVVLLRMLCPIGISSEYSLISIISHLAEKTIVKTVPMEGTGIQNSSNYNDIDYSRMGNSLNQTEVNSTLLPEFSLSNTIQGAASYQPITYKNNMLENFFKTASVIWSIVALAAIIAMIILYLLTKAELKKATHLRDNLYEGTMVTTPTVYGIFKPTIVLPVGVEKEQLEYILAHERVHIKRHDNLWRLVAIVAACIHWFNPLSWLFVKVFLEDCEMACDAAAVKKMKEEERKNYARALLTYSAMDKTIFSSAFGSSKVKVRIKNVLSFKKLTLFSTLCFAGMVLAIAFVLLTNARGTYTVGNSLNQAEGSSEFRPSSLPIPSSDNWVEWECGTFYSSISKENLEEYLQMLSKNGWRDVDGNNFSVVVAEGTTQYTLTRGDNLLQMMIFFNDPEFPICNSLLVKLEENISIEEMESRKDAVDKKEAQELIQPKVTELSAQGEIPYTKDIVTGLFELFPEDAYDTLQLQAYAAISDNGFTGCFLIRKGVVSFVEGNLENACILDIDDDGQYELLDLYDNWDGNLYKINLIAYEYSNPIYFNSCTEILRPKYSTCYVPENGYEELRLEKMDDKEVKLVSDVAEYGTIKVGGTALIINEKEAIPFLPWSVSYDQSQLQGMMKEVPATPPDINISFDGNSLEYVVQETVWNGETFNFTTNDAITKFMEKATFIPTINLGNTLGSVDSRDIQMDFGKSMPDSIHVYDAMLDDFDGIRYGDKSNVEQIVKILDNSHVEFPLAHHIAYFLSSNSADYERDWRRLFRVECTWGDNKCTYAFIINTGKVEQLTEKTEDRTDKIEVPKLELLRNQGSYSMASSSWGLGIEIISTSKELPEEYYIEWQISEGLLRNWNELGTKPIEVEAQHNGYPMTFSKDMGQGAVLWNPISFDSDEDVTIKAYFYKTLEDKDPFAYSELTLGNTAGVYQKK